LLAHGADKSAVDDKGNTALEHAKMQSSAAVLALLEA
jgi:ankyrin repeat protein